MPPFIQLSLAQVVLCRLLFLCPERGGADCQPLSLKQKKRTQRSQDDKDTSFLAIGSVRWNRGHQ